jgi:uncharacterized membrane-anchored protein
MTFILVVDAVVAGVLAGLIANSADGSGVVIALASAVAGSSYFVAWSWRYVRRFRAMQREHKALYPHAAE